jgi:hypothetical protein
LVCSILHQILKAELHHADISIGIAASITIAEASVACGRHGGGANVGVSARANAVDFRESQFTSSRTGEYSVVLLI